MTRVITSVLLFTALAPLLAVAQISDGFYDVELSAVPVAGRVHMIQRPDGFANVGVFVGEEGVLLVDSQFEPHAEDLVAAVRNLSDGAIAALDLAINLAGPNTKVIPGHGVDVVGRGELVQFRDMIVDVAERVRELIAQGKTLDEVMTARPTAAYDERWGNVPSWSANDFVPIVYHQLGGGSLYER